MDTSITPLRQVRADYDENTIVVYQAYSPLIAESAIAAGRFVPPFSLERMTWIKPSFLWMMYRCGWASKPGQERVLAIRITRTGFEEALGHAALSAFDPAIHPSKQVWQAELRNSPTRVQWDPERDRNGSPLAWRSLQIGLSKDMVSRYVHEWIVDMQDITPTLLHRRNVSMPLPVERPFPIPAEIAAKIGVTDTPDLQHLQTQ